MAFLLPLLGGLVSRIPALAKVGQVISGVTKAAAPALPDISKAAGRVLSDLGTGKVNSGKEFGQSLARAGAAALGYEPPASGRGKSISMEPLHIVGKNATDYLDAHSHPSPVDHAGLVEPPTPYLPPVTSVYNPSVSIPASAGGFPSEVIVPVSVADEMHRRRGPSRRIHPMFRDDDADATGAPIQHNRKRTKKGKKIPSRRILNEEADLLEYLAKYPDNKRGSPDHERALSRLEYLRSRYEL